MNGFNLSALAVRERAITLFLIIAVTLAGIFAYLNLGRAEDPIFTVKVLTVQAAWPGATAQEMQDLVADPLEKRLQELQWYDRVETFTRPGVALMTLFLRDQTPPAEVPEQFYQARKKLGDEAKNLPQGAVGPFVNDEYSDTVFAVYALKGGGLPERKLVRQAETVRQRLLHVPGVRKVDLMGEQPERIFVNFSNARLSTLGISPADVFSALQKQNALTAAGSINTDGPQVYIRLDGALDTLEKIRNTPIVSGGHVFSLSDIAEVKRGYDDPPSLLIRNDGAESLVLNVIMKEGWNGLKLGDALREAEKTLGADLPVGVTLTKVTDQGFIIEESINEFMLKFFVALVVVMIVCLVSMGWRVGIVVAAAVPLTLAGVLVIMMLTNRAFDRVTLGALILSLGLLVDDAIIVIESMVVKMEEGYERVKAAAYTWSHTAAPRLAGTLVTIIGFTPIGFARSTAGEYAGNIFWIVGFALLTSWLAAALFTPYLGVKMLPEFKKHEGACEHIYATPNYNRFRRLVAWSVNKKYLVAAVVVALFVLAFVGMGAVGKQFFPSSDRPELLAEVQMPEGTSIEATASVTRRVEEWLRKQPESEVVTTYVGGGAPRFFLAYNPELPDPSFAKLIVQTANEEARDKLIHRLRDQVAHGMAPEARLRVTQLIFGPYTHFPVMFRVMGPDIDTLKGIASRVEAVMRANPNTRMVNQDWGELAPTVHFVLDQDRLHLIGLTPTDAAQQLQTLLNGTAITQIREDIRAVTLVARSDGPERLDPSKLGDMSLVNNSGQLIPVSQIGHIEIRQEEPILRRRDRVPTITLQSDLNEAFQPPEVSAQINEAIKPIVASLPPGYRIETGGNAEESEKANAALATIFPIMLGLIMLVLIVQVRSFSAMIMTLLTAPLGLVGIVPVLLLFNQPFGFNGILGLTGLCGILMRNTLILIGQIHTNQADGLNTYHAVIEATVQRARPVILTALAAILAFMPLTQSVFWGSLAYTLIGGTFAGTVLVLVFLPALYAIWFRVKAPTDEAPGILVAPHETIA